MILDAIISLASRNMYFPMYEKMFNNFLIEKWKWIVHVLHAYLFHDIYFVYVVLGVESSYHVWN